MGGTPSRECWCDYVDIGVGWEKIRPDHGCPKLGHRAEAFAYYDGLTGDDLRAAVEESAP